MPKANKLQIGSGIFRNKGGFLCIRTLLILSAKEMTAPRNPPTICQICERPIMASVHSHEKDCECDQKARSMVWDLSKQMKELVDENIYLISRIRNETKVLTNQQVKDIWGERVWEIINKH